MPSSSISPSAATRRTTRRPSERGDDGGAGLAAAEVRETCSHRPLRRALHPRRGYDLCSPRAEKARHARAYGSLVAYGR
eukprot:2907395-Prymnesium_polylepis.1